MRENPYKSSASLNSLEHASDSSITFSRLRCTLAFAAVGLLTGCLSGYLYFIRPEGRYLPGPIFGLGIAVTTMVYVRKHRLMLALSIPVAASIGFYFAVELWTETGLSWRLERIVMLLVGVAPIVAVYSVILRDSLRWRFIATMAFATFVGGVAFYYFTHARGYTGVLVPFDVLDPRRFAVLEGLRFAGWQTCVAAAIGFELPLRNVATRESKP